MMGLEARTDWSIRYERLYRGSALEPWTSPPLMQSVKDIFEEQDGEEGRPVDPYNYWKRLINLHCWLDDVERQAVFRRSKVIRIRLSCVSAEFFLLSNVTYPVAHALRTISNILVSCGFWLTISLYFIAALVPFQVLFKENGARNLRSPTGGCAYGIPRNKSWL
jgi:hypothetical protein